MIIFRMLCRRRLFREWSLKHTITQLLSLGLSIVFNSSFESLSPLVYISPTSIFFLLRALSKLVVLVFKKPKLAYNAEKYLPNHISVIDTKAEHFSSQLSLLLVP